MLAAVLRNFNELILEDVPMPIPLSTEVVVRIKSCGFCATDYKAIKGIRKNVNFPFIAGHEPSGIISAVGANVHSVKEGDEVICSPSGFCWVCANCRQGNHHYCEHAFTTGGDGVDDVRPGAFAEYMKTDEKSVFHKPKNISFDAGALTEPLSGAWKGLIQYSEMKVGDSVVVIGVGGIGLLCMMVAKAAGASPLIAIDPSAYARNNALTLGATNVIDPSKEEVIKSVYEILPSGPDLIVEAAGSISAVNLMTQLRRRGTRWNLFGITTHEQFQLDGGYTHFLEGRMDASFGTTPLAMQKAIRLMETGLVNPEKIVSHHFALKDIHKAIKVMGEENRNKIIINP